MEISVVGMGYVGTVAAVCLADSGNDVVVVDINPAKIAQLNAGRSPVMEFGLAELIAQNVGRGRLRATDDLQRGFLNSEATIICVGTPSGPLGDVRLTELDRVVDQLGIALAKADSWHLVMLTSTVPPGTTESRIIPGLERLSGKRCGTDFGVAFVPEFLREGSAIDDYRQPAKTVIGASDPQARECAAAIYRPYASKIIFTDIPAAEMVKLTDNSWHALKTAFANEIGRFCASLGINSHAVMEIFNSDTRLNISSAYLTPGFAFGGSCLPKDLRTLVYRARQLGAEVPVLESVLPSNRAHVDAVLQRVREVPAKRIALLGVAFKPGTDDLRESPVVILAEALVGKGRTLRIYDGNVSLARLVGSNKDYIEQQLPHLSSLLCPTIDEVLDASEVIVIGNQSVEFAAAARRCRADQIVIDLVRLPVSGAPLEADYRGICW